MLNSASIVILSCSASIYPLAVYFRYNNIDMFILICASLFFRMLSGIAYISEYYRRDYDFKLHQLIYIADFFMNVVLTMNIDPNIFIPFMCTFIALCISLEFFKEKILMVTFRLALWNILFYFLVGYYAYPLKSVL